MEYSTLQKGVKKMNKRRYRKKGNQSRGSKYNLGEGQCQSFYYTLSRDLLRIYAHREEGEEMGGKANQIVWSFGCFAITIISRE